MKYIIKTEGLMCGHCDASVETELLKVAGVTDADADHETQTVEVETSEAVDTDLIVQAVRAAGEKFRALDVTVA